MKLYVVSESGEDIKAGLKEKFKSGFQKAKGWVVKHKDPIIVLGPVALGVLATGIKVVGKRSNLHKAEMVKNLYCYDRSLGHYWSLRRELSNREWLEIDGRKKGGERLSDILDELKVLK